jgi:hypothetical protein
LQSFSSFDLPLHTSLLLLLLLLAFFYQYHHGNFVICVILGLVEVLNYFFNVIAFLFLPHVSNKVSLEHVKHSTCL